MVRKLLQSGDAFEYFIQRILTSFAHFLKAFWSLGLIERFLIGFLFHQDISRKSGVIESEV